MCFTMKKVDSQKSQKCTNHKQGKEKTAAEDLRRTSKADAGTTEIK